MTTEIKVGMPGVVVRKRVARKPRRCSLCGAVINPSDGYWQKKRSCRLPVCQEYG